MNFKTPPFWYRNATSPPPALERTLDLLSPLYRAIDQWNRKRGANNALRAARPIICVGNAVAGGSGKTPTAIALLKLLRNAGTTASAAPFFLSRGYKGSHSESEAATLVDPAIHGAAEVGDEPLLLAGTAPVVVAADRGLGAEFAILNGASAIIMDDGLQNTSLIKDISFMVIDGAAGFGNLKTLPAGPLREPLGASFTKTDAFILIGADNRGTVALLPENKPLFNAYVRAIPETMPENKNIVAFAGLGRPEKFYHFLKEHNYNVLGWHPFPDHYSYSEDEIAALVHEAKEKNAVLITTEKDFMRLGRSAHKDKISAIKIEVIFEKTLLVADFLKERLS